MSQYINCRLDVRCDRCYITIIKKPRLHCYLAWLFQICVHC